MSNQNILDHTFNETLHAINPTNDDWETRRRIITEFQDVVSSIESLRGATVEPFGSFVSQLFTRWGDLDISIKLFNSSYVSSAGKKHKQNLLGDVLKALQRIGAFHRFQFVPNARVPILKLESRYLNITCDISIDNLSGQMKSKFLFWISLIDRRFRNLVLLVKEWAKANYINNPKAGTFNSYSLSLLVIFHFQTCVPAILPPIRELYPGNMADELKGARAELEKHIEEVCAANIARFRKERKANWSSLSELFVSFMAKYSHIDTTAKEGGICPFTGRWEDIHNNTRWLPQTYALFIEDPFEQPENTARSVNSGQLAWISEVFKTTHLTLTSPHQTRNSLIPLLVRPQILPLFPGIMINRNGGRPVRHVNWANRSVPHQTRQQYQYNGTAQNPRWAFPRPANHHQPGKMNPKVGRARPGQASQGQVQQAETKLVTEPRQVWRPKQSER